MVVACLNIISTLIMMELLSFSDQVKRAIQIAQSLAKENANPEFSPAHLLRAVMNKDLEVVDILKSMKKDIFFIEEWAEVRIESCPKSSKIPEDPKADKDVTAVFNEADNIRIKLASDKIDPFSVLIAICTPGVGFNYEQLKTLPVTPQEVLNHLLEEVKLMETVGKPEGSATPALLKNSALLKFTADKTELAQRGGLDKVVGRNAEIRMIAEILGRKVNSNVLVIGDPGVGKTAVINGFCQIIRGNSKAEWLNGLRVFELLYGNLLAGASYKGEVEDRLQSVFK